MALMFILGLQKQMYKHKNAHLFQTLPNNEHHPDSMFIHSELELHRTSLKMMKIWKIDEFRWSTAV